MSEIDRPTEPAPQPPVEVIMVGAGARARAWAALLERSPRASLVALVARHDDGSLLPRARRHDTLEQALEAHPGARVAVALPERSGLEAALLLAARGRPSLVEAPLALRLATATLPRGAAAVQVAHGWVTARGRGAIERALSSSPARVALVARGLPEGGPCDAGEALQHALALGLRVLPGARLVSAAQTREGRIDVTLEAPGASLSLAALAEGSSLEVTVEAPNLCMKMHTEAATETLTAGPSWARAASKTRAAPTAVERALHQLVAPAATTGDTLEDAKRVAIMCNDVHAMLGRRPPVTRRALAHAARLAELHPGDAAATLGLVGETPSAAPAPSLDLSLPAEPFELWPFVAGAKPVVFLTTTPAEADRVASWFEGAVIERRERLVDVGAQDRWVDRRDRGEPRVELYIARDRSLVEQAIRLQADGDPSASLRQMGLLMGYPRCCVDAFDGLLDRSNNTRLRYVTASRTDARRRWPWQLANMHAMLVPFFPCSYTCEAALSFARASLSALEAAHPGTLARLEARLARPVLYFDHERQLSLGGACDGERVAYADIAVPPWAPGPFRALAGAFSQGDELTFDDGALEVKAGGARLFRLTRTDPALGLLAPFASAVR